MNTILDTSTEQTLITLSVHDYDAELARDVASGMQANPKTLPSKYFYDARGGRLFDEITELPEYYLTRAEMALIARHGGDIIARSGASEVLEVGSGSASKICLLLDQAPPLEGLPQVETYSAIDINGAALRSAGHALQERHPSVAFTGYVGDFVADLAKVPRAKNKRLLAFFGSTIGNLDPLGRATFFTDVAAMLGAGDSFLLGVDLVKDRAVLHRAYNDGRGITAEFTRNILRVLNRELKADFPVDVFEHLPVWNEAELRMEAWLRAPYPISVNIRKLGLKVNFRAQEEILTEVSCKFTRDGVEAELRDAGLSVCDWLTDSESTFALALARLRTKGS